MKSRNLWYIFKEGATCVNGRKLGLENLVRNHGLFVDLVLGNDGFWRCRRGHQHFHPSVDGGWSAGDLYSGHEARSWQAQALVHSQGSQTAH